MRHIIKIALILNAGVAAAFVWLFSAPFGWFIASLAAGSLVSTYVGLAFAAVPTEQRRRAQGVAMAACAVESAYGFLFVLAQQSPQWFAPPLPWYGSVPLALLHGAAFSLIAFFISLFVVHERGAVAQSGTPSAADERDRAIAEALIRFVERMDGTVVAHVAQQPVHDAPAQIEQHDDETIEIGGKSYSIRTAAERLGVSPTTLRRKLEQTVN